MKTKHLHPLPAPRPGWEWIIGKVYPEDKFMGYEGKVVKSGAKHPHYFTDGPSVWHKDGELTFAVSGYIRKTRKSNSPSAL